MSDDSTMSALPTSVVKDFSNIPIAENVPSETPPPYEQNVNPTPLNNPNNSYSSPVPYQQQPQMGPMGNVPYQTSPPYGQNVNPTPLNNPNNSYSSPVSYQQQPQMRPMGNVLYQTSPPYGQNVNPNNSYSIPVQYQPQPQMGPMGNISNIPTTYNPGIQQISNYKVWSIINIILGFCCGLVPMILAIIACYCSLETDTFKLRNDIPGALGASKYARILNIIATVLIVLIFIGALIPILIFFGVLASL
jgi:hypothetical protein